MDSEERADELSGVYVIQCVSTGQVYVGSSASVRTRKAAHWRELRAGRHANRGLQQAWLTYGEAAFTFEVAEAVVGVAALREAERAHMERLRAREPEHGFNVAAPWATAVSERYYQELAWMLKALADESRLRIIGLLATSERSVDELAALLKLRAPTISHHLAMLREASMYGRRHPCAPVSPSASTDLAS